MSLRADIEQLSGELGFDAFGVARAEPLEEERARLESWLARGYAGTMAYVGRHADLRLDPERILPGARSVLCFAHVYETDPDTASSASPVARYARGRDYHRVLRGKLRRIARHLREARPEAATRICVDTAPVLEKAWAERAGIGWRGKHTNLVMRTRGSFTVLGEILTTLEIEPDRPHQDFCGSCTRCLDACPTSAFPEPYVMDARRCISYLTIEHRGPFESSDAARVGEHLFGCDVCIDVCPWNRFHEPTAEPDFRPRPEVLGIDAGTCAESGDEELEPLLRGSALRRAGPEGLRRNARAILGNRDPHTT